MTDAAKEKKNLYQVAIDDILKKIEENDFSFEKPICTEKTLMETYNFSRITAKRAIMELEHEGILYRKRGVGSFVSRDIYAKASGSSEEDMKIFAFVLPFDITKGGLFETVQTINTLLGSANAYMCIYITDCADAKEKSILKQLIKQNINGIVLYPKTNNIHLELLNSFVVNDKPVVVIDKGHDCRYIGNVLSDNFSGGVMLTEHLLSLGHKNIAYLSRSGSSGLTSISDRFGGYIHALKKAGITPNKDYMASYIDSLYKSETNPGQGSLKDTVKALYNAGVTAIETENDQVAFAVIHACGELSLKVPEDLSVCGFDNSEWAHMSDMGITTIKQNFHEIGSKIAGIFLDGINNKTTGYKKVIVPVELIIQGSSGPARIL